MQFIRLDVFKIYGVKGTPYILFKTDITFVVLGWKIFYPDSRDTESRYDRGAEGTQ